MSRHRLFFVLFCVLTVLGMAPGAARSEILGPGTYRGYFTVTRWGQKVFHCGPYHLFVSDAAARTLDAHRGKPLELEVSELSQPMNPGAGLIEKVARVTEKGIASGLVLSAQLKSNKVLQGQGILLGLSLRNDSEKAITISPGTLAIVFVTDSPFSNDDIGYKDPDERSYWYYSYGYRSFKKDDPPLRIACREVMLPWTAESLVSQGRNVRVADAERGFNGPVLIEPKGEFEAEFAAGKELLPDDYEVFFYLTSGNLSSVPGPMSDRLPFDVVKTTMFQADATPQQMPKEFAQLVLRGRYVTGEPPIPETIALEDYKQLKRKYSLPEERTVGSGPNRRSYELILDWFDDDAATVAVVEQFKSKGWNWVKAYRVKRSPDADKELGIPAILTERLRTIGGVKYGMPIREVLELKGKGYKVDNHAAEGSATLIYDDVLIWVMGWDGRENGWVARVDAPRGD